MGRKSRVRRFTRLPVARLGHALVLLGLSSVALSERPEVRAQPSVVGGFGTLHQLPEFERVQYGSRLILRDGRASSEERQHTRSDSGPDGNGSHDDNPLP